MTKPKKRTADVAQLRGGLFGYVSGKLAGWVWYDTHIPLSPMAHHPRLAPITDNLSVGPRGRS